MKRVFIILLILTLTALTFSSCGQKENNPAKEQGTISASDIDTPAELSDKNVDVDELNCNIPEGFGSLATDNTDYSDLYFENSKGLGLNIMNITPKQFKEYGASTPSGVIKSMTEGSASCKDITVDGHSGKIYAFKDGGNVIEMDLAVEVSGHVYLAVLYGEGANGDAIPIDKDTQQVFGDFCRSIKF